MKNEDITRAEPVFDFENYFLGHTKASGWFCDRFGNIRKHFTGDFFGSRDAGHFMLDETLSYSDGINEKRLWKVKIDADGKFRAESTSLHGYATGRLLGNALNLRYTMSVTVANNKTWKLSMDDWMVLQPDGALHNVTKVSKFGILVGTVSTQYSKINRVINSGSGKENIEGQSSANDSSTASLSDVKAAVKGAR